MKKSSALKLAVSALTARLPFVLSDVEEYEQLINAIKTLQDMQSDALDEEIKELCELAADLRRMISD